MIEILIEVTALRGGVKAKGVKELKRHSAEMINEKHKRKEKQS